MTHASGYVGRFAPSPSGPLHAGSMVAALASWLDARAHDGRWLVRIEDVDMPRCTPGTAARVLEQLDACGLRPDAPPLFQSTRADRYAAVLDTLRAAGLAYPCTCSRSAIAQALARAGATDVAHEERVYPGTCRPRAGSGPAEAGASRAHAAAWRLRTHDAQGGAITIDWRDRRLGLQRQDVTREVGDFVLQRADGLWAYQLAVVVDDADQGVTDVVRGEDLADNTARQVHLQRVAGLPTPHYLHTPLVYAEDGQKLSKQTGARAIDVRTPRQALATLRDAARTLGLPPWVTNDDDGNRSLADWLARCTSAWADVAPPLGPAVTERATRAGIPLK